jgi:hypothetical protein
MIESWHGPIASGDLLLHWLEAYADPRERSLVSFSSRSNDSDPPFRVPVDIVPVE